MNRFFTLIASIICISITSHCEPPKNPTIILGLINNGILQLEKYSINEFTGTLMQEVRKQHTLYTLDLSNAEYCFNSITCDQTTNNLIKLSSQDITDEHSYVINWGTLFGINIADYHIDFISFIPWQHHEITSSNTRLDAETNKTVMKAFYTNNGYVHEEVIRFDCKLESIFGIITSEAFNLEPIKSSNLSTVAQAIEQGILVAEKNVTIPDKKFTMERDAEFDRIIDAMSHDGIIKFQKVTPFIALLRRVGGIVLVKYLMVKKYLCNLFHYAPCQQVPVHEQEATNKTLNNILQ